MRSLLRFKAFNVKISTNAGRSTSCQSGDDAMFEVLIVEDDPQFRQILKEILTSLVPSASIMEETHGVEALPLFAAHRPGLVLMDIKLPEMNGLELTKRMKDVDPGVPVIIITNHDTPEYRQAALECGADYFISKASSIGEEIERAVQSVRSTTEGI
jgi:DNA-binding NarL/FixJ family response regulator